MAVQPLMWAGNVPSVEGMSDEKANLNGQLLIAMPGMGDPRFEKSVVFMCAHSEDGALGLIVNKPTPELTFSKLLQQLEIDVQGSANEVSIHFGGPVEHLSLIHI